MRRLLLLLVPLALVAGCGSASPKSADDDSEQRALRFARCLREQGLDVPDPVVDRSGSVGFSVQRGGPGKGGNGPDPERMEAAMSACRKYAPNGGKPPSAADQQRMRDAALDFARCMRSHGVDDFPDPQVDGGGIRIGGPGAAINPSSPTFQAAQKECQKLLPLPKGGDGGPSVSEAP